MRPHRRRWREPGRGALCAAVAVALTLLAALPLRGDRVALLSTDREAAVARAAIVLRAEREILVSAFIFGDDPFTLTSLGLLRDAARRGVQVHLLVDAQWNAIPAPVIAHLREEGVQVREFHRFRLGHPIRTLKRLHDKLLVVDGRWLVAGGRNVESPYFGFGHQQRRRNYLDLDLFVEGEAAGAARAYFLALWQSRRVSPIRPRATAAAVAEAAADLDRHAAWLAARVAAERAGGDLLPALREAGAVRFLHDPVEPRADARKVGDELRDLLDAASSSLIVESPYLVPTRALREGIRRAVARGVRVRILTNSLAVTDNLWPQAAYVGDKEELVADGVELWEYRGPECLHSKAAVIDGRRVVVGSYNLDPRSQRLNRELVLVVDDEALAAQLRAQMDEHLTRAWRIGPDGAPATGEDPFAGVGRGKRWRLRLLRLIVPLVRGQV